MTFAGAASFAAFALLVPVCLGAQELPVLAEQNAIRIEDGYARSSGGMAQSGAAFMHITNTGTSDDRLISARSAAAGRLELHTHAMADGIAHMGMLEDGIPLPAGETVVLERGGMHLMFLGLTGPWQDGDTLDVKLVFANAGEIDVQIPVDLARKPDDHDHGPDD